MTRRRALGAGFIGVVLALAFPSAAGAEVPVSQVGWWTRSPSKPAVPEGGISVAAAPDGDLTVGAIVIDAGDGGASGASVRLVEASGAAGAEVAAIQVCPTSSSWAPVAGGALAEAPKDECETASVTMTRGADGTWTADVQALVDGRTGDVGLIVKPAAGAVAFQLSFAPPAVNGSVSEGAGTETPPPTTATTTAPSASPSAASNATARPSAPSFVAPVSPMPTAPSAQSAPQVAAAPSDGSSATAQDVAFTPQVGAAVPTGGGTGSDVTKGVIVLWYVLALVVGAAVAGIVWLRNEGRLSPAVLLARTRRSS